MDTDKERADENPNKRGGAEDAEERKELYLPPRLSVLRASMLIRFGFIQI